MEKTNCLGAENMILLNQISFSACDTSNIKTLFKRAHQTVSAMAARKKTSAKAVKTPDLSRRQTEEPWSILSWKCINCISINLYLFLNVNLFFTDVNTEVLFLINIGFQKEFSIIHLKWLICPSEATWTWFSSWKVKHRSTVFFLGT